MNRSEVRPLAAEGKFCGGCNISNPNRNLNLRDYVRPVLKSGGTDGGGTLCDLERLTGVVHEEARGPMEPAAGGGEKPPNVGALPAALLAGLGTAADDEPPVRSVTSEAAAVAVAVAALGLVQTGDGRLNAAARLSPPASSCCS